MRPCFCHHDRSFHIIDSDGTMCIKCDCTEFREIGKAKMVAKTTIQLSLNERNILIQSLKRNVANIDTATFLSLIERLK